MWSKDMWSSPRATECVVSAWIGIYLFVGCVCGSGGGDGPSLQQHVIPDGHDLSDLPHYNGGDPDGETLF